jgi:hypothetical protein
MKLDQNLITYFSTLIKTIQLVGIFNQVENTKISAIETQRLIEKT